MKFVHALAAATGLAALLSHDALAQTSATQTFSIQVQAINQIAMGAGPSLLINSATPGSAPTSVQSTTSTWAVTTNQSGSTISASIASPMPTGLTLSASLAAPAGGATTGMHVLSQTAVAMVTGVTKVNASGLGMTYQLDATVAAGVVTSATKTVTFTITGGV